MTEGPPVAIVTGAGSGIGAATARLLAEAGSALALVGRTADKLAATAKNVADALPIAVDLSEPGAPGIVVDRTLQRWGRVDVLVNNAGTGALVPIDRTTDDVLLDAFRINAFAPIRLVALLWPTFLRQGSGCVVNVSSMATSDPFPGFTAYAAAKSALESLTRSIMNEGGEHGMRAYNVAPGAVETPLLRANFDTQQLPPERTLDPADVARVIVACIERRRDSDLGQTILLPSS
jgi:short-subunit dehydrogenase